MLCCGQFYYINIANIILFLVPLFSTAFFLQDKDGGPVPDGVKLPDVEIETEMPETLDLSSCFSPPLDCPNENISFYLYTKETQDSPFLLEPGNEENLKKAPFAENRPIKVLIHGYTGHRDFSPNAEIRPALLQQGEYNVITVDWGKLAKPPCYIQAANNVELSGSCTAQLIDNLVRVRNLPLRNFHVIGFSLGAQVSGQVARHLKSGKLRRITGLDPAMPLFASLYRSAVLDRTDAHFVDIIHTNAGNKGKYGPNGHVDFYVNGGAYQPGCQGPEVYDAASCAHARAPMLYAESIESKEGFWGRECSSWMSYSAGMCKWAGAQLALMGEQANPQVRGQFFLNTNSQTPFALGKIGSAGNQDIIPTYNNV